MNGQAASGIQRLCPQMAGGQHHSRQPDGGRNQQTQNIVHLRDQAIKTVSNVNFTLPRNWRDEESEVDPVDQMTTRRSVLETDDAPPPLC